MSEGTEAGPVTALDAAWKELIADALASDGPISDADVKNAVKRNRPRIEAAYDETLAERWVKKMAGAAMVEYDPTTGRYSDHARADTPSREGGGG